MSEATFIGIDLAWRGGEKQSGVAVLQGDRQRARLVDTALIHCGVLPGYVDRYTTKSTVVAIDGPLVICNQNGQRRCETLLGRAYGARDASCHSSNLSLYPNAASVRLESQMESRGFKHAPNVTRLDEEHVMLEVYPHVALLELFRLPRVLKYKKGNITEKRRGQQDLQHLLKKLSAFSPPLKSNSKLAQLLETDTNSLRGVTLKANEDKLDAVLCAYVAYHYWYWDGASTRLFGDVDSGYIIVPRLPQGSWRD
ncbi:MAG TPA: DUF429 domain-containing protein [Candidatus Angelobacter sp.]|nr:DUF429 domain-containing protein [Candidatus Angelobacter sp.]